MTKLTDEERRRRAVASEVTQLVCEKAGAYAEETAEEIIARPDLLETEDSAQVEPFLADHAQAIYDVFADKIDTILENNGVAHYRDTIETWCTDALFGFFDIVLSKVYAGDRPGAIEIAIEETIPWLDRHLEKALRRELAELDSQAVESDAVATEGVPATQHRTRRPPLPRRPWIGRRQG